MLTLAWTLLVVVPLAAVVFLIWLHRKKSAERAAQSSRRFAEIFDSAATRGPVVETPPQEKLAHVPSPSLPDAAAAMRSAALYARRERLLSTEQLQVRRLLEAALPGHPVFSQVSLAAVIDVAGLPEGREREQRQRALAQQTVDCVVCDSGLGVVAVVELDGGSSAEVRFKSECLKAAGVRYLRWNARALPRSDDIAAQIAGAAASDPGG